MKYLSTPFTIAPHDSGKNTCYVATTIDTGINYFVKFLRTYENEFLTIDEMFNEIAEERILSSQGISDLGHSVELVNSRLAVVQRYYPKSWSQIESEHLEAANIADWATLLAVETWVRQSDRGAGSLHHVAGVIVDGQSMRYRPIPLDLGNSFSGHPSGYNGIDEDLTVDWVKTLFWATKQFPRQELEEALLRIEKTSINQVINKTLEHILEATNWSDEYKTHLIQRADMAANFLYARRLKLRNVLLAWWDQTRQAIPQVEINIQQPQPVQ